MNIRKSKFAGGGARLLALLFALLTAVGASAWSAPSASAADVTWENIYSCDEAPNTSTPCGGPGWSCRLDHDGSYGTNPDGSELKYHFYVCTWSGGGGGGGGGGTVTPPPTRYYYARLEFDANDGSGAPSELTRVGTDGNSGYTFDIPAEKPTRAGYTFLGWGTYRNATEPSYSNPAKTGASTTSATIYVRYDDTVTLYAVWEKTVTSRLVYHAGPDADDPTAVYTRDKGQKVTISGFDASNLKAQGFVMPDGMRFLGWSTTPKGTAVVYGRNQTFTYGTKDVNLYPVFEPTGTVVSRMPTAGAPMADWTAPAAVLALGAAGVGFGILRGRRAHRRR